MSDISRIIKMLQNEDHNKRYEACEELRTSQSPLSQEALNALAIVKNDKNPDVADAARRALEFHNTREPKTEKASDMPIDSVKNEKRVSNTGVLIFYYVLVFIIFLFACPIIFWGAAVEGNSYLFCGMIVFILLVIAPLLFKSNENNKSQCPYCGETIKKAAVICRHCGKELPTTSSIFTEIQEVTNEIKFTTPEIKDNELAKWRAGFYQIGWLESVGENTQSALSSTNAAHISQDTLIFVAYADVNGTRFTRLSFNQTDMFSPFSCLIATSQKILFVRPDKKIVNSLKYEEINKIDYSKNVNKSVTYNILSKFGDTIQITIEYINVDDEKLIQMFFERISSAK